MLFCLVILNIFATTTAISSSHLPFYVQGVGLVSQMKETHHILNVTDPIKIQFLKDKFGFHKDFPKHYSHIEVAFQGKFEKATEFDIVLANKAQKIHVEMGILGPKVRRFEESYFSTKVLDLNGRLVKTLYDFGDKQTKFIVRKGKLYGTRHELRVSNVKYVIFEDLKGKFYLESSEMGNLRYVPLTKRTVSYTPKEFMELKEKSLAPNPLQFDLENPNDFWYGIRHRLDPSSNPLSSYKIKRFKDGELDKSLKNAGIKHHSSISDLSKHRGTLYLQTKDGDIMKTWFSRVPIIHGKTEVIRRVSSLNDRLAVFAVTLNREIKPRKLILQDPLVPDSYIHTNSDGTRLLFREYRLLNSDGNVYIVHGDRKGHFKIVRIVYENNNLGVSDPLIRKLSVMDFIKMRNLAMERRVRRSVDHGSSLNLNLIKKQHHASLPIFPSASYVHGYPHHGYYYDPYHPSNDYHNYHTIPFQETGSYYSQPYLPLDNLNNEIQVTDSSLSSDQTSKTAVVHGSNMVPTMEMMDSDGEYE